MNRMSTGYRVWMATLVLLFGVLTTGCRAFYSRWTIGSWATRSGEFPNRVRRGHMAMVEHYPLGTFREAWYPPSDSPTPAPLFGGPPYSAVACDIAFVVKDPGPWSPPPGDRDGVDDRGAAVAMGLFSLPLDLCWDTVLLPADLFCWILKKKKPWPYGDAGKGAPVDGEGTSPP